MQGFGYQPSKVGSHINGSKMTVLGKRTHDNPPFNLRYLDELPPSRNVRPRNIED